MNKKKKRWFKSKSAEEGGEEEASRVAPQKLARHREKWEMVGNRSRLRKWDEDHGFEAFYQKPIASQDPILRRMVRRAMWMRLGLVFFLLIVVVVLGMGIGAFYQRYYGKPPEEVSVERKKTSLSDRSQGSGPLSAKPFSFGEEKVSPAGSSGAASPAAPTRATGGAGEDPAAAAKVLREYLETETMEARLKAVLPRQGQEGRMGLHYKQPAERRFQEEEIELGEPEAVRLGKYEVIRIPVQSQRGPWEAHLRRGKHGRYLLEWEDWVAFQEVDVRTFQSERVTRPSYFRCWLTRSEHYDTRYARDEYLSVRVEMPITKEVLHAYIHRGSAFATKLLVALDEAKGARFKAGLRLAYPSSSSQDAKVVLIREVVAYNWLQR